MGDTMGVLPHDSHYQSVVTTIAHKYNMPGVFYLDLWPAGCGQVIVTDPDVALHLTVTKNHPKHEAEKWFCELLMEDQKQHANEFAVDPLIGTNNIVTIEGPLWKYLHKMLSPAFSVQHISNMRPAVSPRSDDARSLH
jgi:cytochrome P450